MRTTKPGRGQLVALDAMVGVELISQHALPQPPRCHSARHQHTRHRNTRARQPTRVLPSSYRACSCSCSRSAPTHPTQDIVRRAKRRIFLSSLYLSASEHHLVRLRPPRVRIRSLALASISRHRTTPKRPSSPPSHARLQPLDPARPGLARPRPPPPIACPWPKSPCLPLSQPKPQRSHDHTRPAPLQRGLGHMASKNIRRRRRHHHHWVSLAVAWYPSS